MPVKSVRPRKIPRQQRSAETRARILDAAAEVFGTHGYAAGTTNRIAAAAGLSVGSLYQYFPNKDAVLVELMRAHVEDGIAEIARRLASVESLPEGIEARLALFVDAAMANHRGHPGLHRVLFEESPVPADLRDELERAQAWAVELATTALEADPSVFVAEPRVAAYVVVTTIESATHRYLSGGDRYATSEQFAAHLVAMLAAYLRNQPGPAGASAPRNRAGRVPDSRAQPKTLGEAS